MTDIAKYILALVALANIAVILVPYLRGTGELLSCRNFFLLGFTIYQITSGIVTLHNPFSFATELTLSRQDDIAIEFAMWVVIFEILFLVAYQWGLGARRFAQWTPIIRGEPREAVLWIFAFTLLGVALVLRFSVLIPYVAIITTHIGWSVAAVAAGLGAWIWVRRPLNPAAAGFMFLILFLAIAINISGAFGRRPIAAIGGCLAWATYYSRWRNLPPASVIGRAAVFGIIPLILVAKFTAARNVDFQDSSLGVFSRIYAIAKADTVFGIKDLFFGQECAAWSMHLMERYPEYHEYRHLHAIKFYFQFSIPRAIWPEKPDALAIIAVSDADIAGVPEGFSIGPGILGHAGAEGGLYALVLYAIVLGFFIRYFDAVLERAPMQPFVALPIGSSLGNLIGIPRGETPNFAYEFTVGVMGAFLMLVVVARLLKLAGLIAPEDLAREDDTDSEDHPPRYDPELAASYSEGPDAN